MVAKLGQRGTLCLRITPSLATPGDARRVLPQTGHVSSAKCVMPLCPHTHTASSLRRPSLLWPTIRDQRTLHTALHLLPIVPARPRIVRAFFFCLYLAFFLYLPRHPSCVRVMPCVLIQSASAASVRPYTNASRRRRCLRGSLAPRAITPVVDDKALPQLKPECAT